MTKQFMKKGKIMIAKMPKTFDYKWKTKNYSGVFHCLSKILMMLKKEYYYI